jgi:hypothetical protein
MEGELALFHAEIGDLEGETIREEEGVEIVPTVVASSTPFKDEETKVDDDVGSPICTDTVEPTLLLTPASSHL